MRTAKILPFNGVQGSEMAAQTGTGNQGNQVTKRYEQEPRTSSTSTTGAPARARNCSDREIGALAAYYRESYQRDAPPVAIRAMREAMAAGMDARVIARCIDEAMMAPRPSWAYAQAVMRNCLREGALTPEDWEARADKWQRNNAARHGSGKLPEQDYAQREYTEADLAYLCADVRTLANEDV